MQSYSYRNFIYFSQLLRKQQGYSQPDNLGKYEQNLKNFIKVISKDENSKDENSKQTLQIVKNFLIAFGQTRCRVNVENIMQNLELIKIVQSKERKAYSISKQIPKHKKQKIAYRGYVIYGKAISVYKRSKSTATKNLTEEQIDAKVELTENVYSTMLRMYEDNRLPIIKSQPHQVEDLLLQHEMPDENTQPIVVSHQVFSSWIPLNQAIILLIPDRAAKPQILSMVRSSLLHIYMDDVLALSKICSKENFHKNSQFKGIYYIEEGQVQVKSGRVIARGWAIQGKCRNSGLGWRFKPLPFLKFVAGNDNIWKQFYNDISLNDELPFRISSVLTIDDEYQEKLNGQERKFKTKKRRMNIRLPEIRNKMGRDMIEKFAEMQKMRHFNGKPGQIQFKQQVVQTRLNRSLHFEKINTQPGIGQQSQRQMKKKIDYFFKKASMDHQGMKRQMSKQLAQLRKSPSNENVYVTSVLKKLKSMNTPKDANKSEQQQVQKSQRTKFLGYKKFEQMKQNQKNRRCKGKNKYG